MKKFVGCLAIAVLAVLVSMPPAQAQKYQSTPVDMSSFWNADGWERDDLGDPPVGTNHESSPGTIWILDGGSAERVRVSTLPETIVPGQVNVTEDGTIAFLLPEFEPDVLDAYYPTGDTIPVPSGNYEWIFFAVMSGSGNWPGSASQWADDVDPDTGEVLESRPEVNCFKPVYSDGEGDWIPIGIVNDWFWKVPEWVAPESGNPDEVIMQYLAYEGDPNGPIYLWDGSGYANHDYGQYTYANGDGAFFTYFMEIPVGLTEATLWTELWGNVKFSISSDDVNYTEVFNSLTSDQEYPSGGDGYFPNRELRSFDLAPFLAGGDVDTLYFKCEDIAPAQGWGPRLRNIGIFTGPVVKSSLGARLWPGLIRSGGNAPEGGLILIYKQYKLDASKTLESIIMPTNIPRQTPILTVFGITLSTGESTTEIYDFMLY